MPEVRVIPPVAERAHKLRVAAYARVSSDSEDQLNTFAAHGNLPGYTPTKQ